MIRSRSLLQIPFSTLDFCLAWACTDLVYVTTNTLHSCMQLLYCDHKTLFSSTTSSSYLFLTLFAQWFLSLGRRGAIYIPFKALYSLIFSVPMVSCGLCVNQYLLKWKFLQGGLKDVLIREYKYESLGINAVLCHFSRIIVVGSHQGLLTCLALIMGNKNGFAL